MTDVLNAMLNGILAAGVVVAVLGTALILIAIVRDRPDR